jgi:hypothetical protein
MSDNDKPSVIDAGAGDAAAEPDQIGSGETEPAAAASGELVRISRAEGALMPLPAEQVVEGMRQYQKLLRELLEPSDWQTHDKNGNPLEKPFLKKSGWRKIARAFNLSFERVHSRVERDEDGTPARAEVWIRAVAPNGQYGDGDGYSSADEGRFKSWRGRQKLENDLRATATTRAKNRAIADLVGMGEVSAEEIIPGGDSDDDTAQALAAGARASDELARRAFAGLAQLLGGHEAARRVGERIAQDHGYLPVAVGRALCYAAGAQAARHPNQERPAENAGDENGAAGEQADTGEEPAANGGQGLEDEDQYRHEATRVLALARQGGYKQATLRAVCELLYGSEQPEQLAGLELRQLAELLRTAIAGGTGDDTLRRATERCAEHADRDEGRSGLRRWLVERSLRPQPKAA